VNPAAVMLPLVLAVIAFDVFCLADIARAEEVRRLPRGAWAIICLMSVLGGIIYLAAGRVRPAHEYQRGYRAAKSTLAWARDAVRPGLEDLAAVGFDLGRWAQSQKAALGAAAAEQPGAAGPGFRLPGWFPPLADDLGSLLDPVGFERWSFTPAGPFVRGYQAALREAWEAAEPSAARA
jgi:Phospholipase_D-nuclease N-terminal